MCGLFGAIGYGWNGGTVRALAVMNRERGTDSLGFFDSSGKMIKCASDPADALRKANISKWLEASEYGCEKTGRNRAWFVAGHTRLATRGKVNRQNSHPFRFGEYIGSHNGMVDAPRDYAVDSMYLIDLLAKSKGDYQAALGDVSGYWGLTWYDGKSFYVQVHSGDLTIAQVGSVWYYSSNVKHLETAIGPVTTKMTLTEGQTIKFTPNGTTVMMEVLTPIKVNTTYSRYGSYDGDWEDWRDYGNYKGSGGRRHGKGAKGWSAGSGAVSYYNSKGSTGTSGTTNTSNVRDYDEEWRSAWESYCTDSEHAST